MADYGKLLVNVTTDTGQFPIQNARVTIYVIETTIPVNRQLLEGEQRVDEQSPGQQKCNHDLRTTLRSGYAPAGTP